MARHIGENWKEVGSVEYVDGKAQCCHNGRSYDSILAARRGMKYDKYYVKAEGYWMHRPRIKCIINPILRKLQFWTRKPYVIASITEFKDGVPYFVRYSFTRVAYIRAFRNN